MRRQNANNTHRCGKKILAIKANISSNFFFFFNHNMCLREDSSLFREKTSLSLFGGKN